MTVKVNTGSLQSQSPCQKQQFPLTVADFHTIPATGGNYNEPTGFVFTAPPAWLHSNETFTLLQFHKNSSEIFTRATSLRLCRVFHLSLGL